MTIDRMVELLKIEHECMLRNSHGGCGRRCENCDLAQNDEELHEMYTDVIGVLKAQEPVEPIAEIQNDLGDTLYKCGECGHYLMFYKAPHCITCGRAVKWA